MQGDAYAGFNGLYVAGRKPGPITEAACWAHGRSKFYELVELRKARSRGFAPHRRAVCDRAVNGLSPDQRLAERRERPKPRGHALEA